MSLRKVPEWHFVPTPTHHHHHRHRRPQVLRCHRFRRYQAPLRH